MASILEEYNLTIEKFEGAIGVGMSKLQILTMFNKKSKEMDEWCMENYKGHNFAFVYEWVRQCAINEYFETLKSLGCRGNVSALAIVDKAIQKYEADQTVKIVFSGNVEEENDEDKSN